MYVFSIANILTINKSRELCARATVIYGNCKGIIN